jgi:lysophospholipase L1-like esterase
MMGVLTKTNRWLLMAVFALICSFNGIKEKNLHIVFIGDSITYGAGVGDRDHFAPPAVAAGNLQQMPLVKKVTFFNAGKSGATTLDFLPGTGYFNGVVAAADGYYADIQKLSERQRKADLLIFSIMLGTNDSAIEGTHGAPVTAEKYKENMMRIIDSLLSRYPGCKVVIQEAPWYSDNTYNGAKYLKAGRERLLSYNPALLALVAHYEKEKPGTVYLGDKSAFAYFRRNYKRAMKGENGRRGVFYLHPNNRGSGVLGGKWAKAIYKVAFKEQG